MLKKDFKARVYISACKSFIYIYDLKREGEGVGVCVCRFSFVFALKASDLYCRLSKM